MRIEEMTAAGLEAYSTVPIAFSIRSKVKLDELTQSGGAVIVEEPVVERWKDYDAEPEERPTALDNRFGVLNWGILAAFDDDCRLGGAIVARDTPGFDMLRGRADLAVLVDLRVAPDNRGRGVGRNLFRAAMDWARAHGCVELHVETQDTNVAACRFYQAMGCTLESADPNGYGAGSGETKLIWQIDLRQ